MRMSQMASSMRQQQQTAAYRQQSALQPQAPVLPLAASSSFTQQPQQQPGSSLSSFQQQPLPGQVQRQVSDDSNSKARRMTPQTAAPMRATPFALNASHLEGKDEYREEVPHLSSTTAKRNRSAKHRHSPAAQQQRQKHCRHSLTLTLPPSPAPLADTPSIHPCCYSAYIHRCATS